LKKLQKIFVFFFVVLLLTSCVTNRGTVEYGKDGVIVGGKGKARCKEPDKRYNPEITAKVSTEIDKLKDIPYVKLGLELHRSVKQLSVDYSQEGLDLDLILFRICEMSLNRGLTNKHTVELTKKAIEAWKNKTQGSHNNTVPPIDVPVEMLQIQFPTPGDFPLDGEIRATGNHSLPLNNRVWALLGDAYGNFYLQNPPVRLHRNGSWSVLLRPGHGIISLYIVLVDENGNNQFKQKVKNKEWGGFTELPFNSRVLNSVESE